MSNAPIIEGVVNLEEIGRGGFGVVYRGEETGFDRTVAVKVLLPTLDDRTRRRFERERRAMGAVSGHQNIVHVYRGGRTADDQPYLVMEYLPGGALNDRIRNHGPLDWREAGLIGAKLADALTVAHRAGILHRDVKPANVFMSQTGEPKLGDFGIARLDDGQDSRSGSITASIAHAPPEIIDGQRGDERSDLYSLASTVYSLTMGTAPFARDPDQGLALLLSKITNADPPPLHLETAATEFETVLMRGLSKRPEDRPATLEIFGNQLRRAISASTPPPAPTSDSTPPPTIAAARDASVAPAPAVPPSTAPGGGQDISRPTAETTTRTSSGHLVMMAMLALAIFGFGGWAVARAVSADPRPVNESVDRTTTVVLPTETPREEPSPEPAPSATPEPAPSATPEPAEPTVVPEAEPTSDVRGTGFNGDIPAGYGRTQDITGTIRVAAPTHWLGIQYDNDDNPEEVEGIAHLSIGAPPYAIGLNEEDRDLTQTGVFIFVARFDSDFNGAGEILDANLQGYPACALGIRSQILMLDADDNVAGNADYQILECDRDDGESTGIVLAAFVLIEDPSVAVGITIQFAEKDDLESLEEILSSIEIDPTKLVGTA